MFLYIYMYMYIHQGNMHECKHVLYSHFQCSQLCFIVSVTCVRGGSSIIKPTLTGSNHLVHTESKPRPSSETGMGVHCPVSVVQPKEESVKVRWLRRATFCASSVLCFALQTICVLRFAFRGGWVSRRGQCILQEENT